MESVKMKILSHMALKGYDKKEMAKMMNLSMYKLRKKLNNPSDITLGEMNKMIEILDIERPGDVFYNA